MGFDLRKTLGLYNAEREARKALSALKNIIGIDLAKEAVHLGLSKAGLSKEDALRFSEVLREYGESK